MIETSPGALFNAGTAILVAAIAMYVWYRAPNHPASRRFTVFGVGLGLALTLNNLYGTPDLRYFAYTSILEGLGWALVAAGSLALSFVAPLTLSRAERHGIRARIWLAIAFTAAPFVPLMVVVTTHDWPGSSELIGSLPNLSAWCALAAAISVWGMRAHGWTIGGHTRYARDAAVLALGIAPLAGLAMGDLLPELTVGNDTTAFSEGGLLISLGIMAMAIASWLPVAIRPGPTRRLATAVILVYAGAAAVQAGLFRDTGDLQPSWGIARIVGGLVIGYGILRYQLFDIDLKLKVGISRGTVGAVMATVFTVVGMAGSEYLFNRFSYVAGALAAGAVLLALRPLRRLGDGIANRFLPGVDGSPAYVTGRKEEVYGDAFATLIRDGDLSDKEKDMLANLAQSLGLGPADVRRIEKTAGPV